MTEEVSNFLEGEVDILKEIPQEVLDLSKEKIRNDDFFQLIISLNNPCLKVHKDYIKACDNPEWKDSQGNLITKEEKEEIRKLHENTLRRYNNYLRLLIKTDGFETCNI